MVENVTFIIDFSVSHVSFMPSRTRVTEVLRWREQLPLHIGANRNDISSSLVFDSLVVCIRPGHDKHLLFGIMLVCCS